MTPFLSRHRITIICLALAAATMALYWPITRHDFVNIDDPRFIFQNPHTQAGLTRGGVVWAFQTFDTENWQPLTWLSHMLDCQMYGLNPGGHHLTSLLFHVTNSLLLFLWLAGLTQAPWRSALVAALFAWHPLHVESVAWACERKDVLSTFFWLLALIAYTRYAESLRTGARPDAGTALRHPGRPALFFLLTLAAFACGLMSKPMVVTLPCVLLLLDFWPLNRFGFLDQAGALPGPERRRKIAWLFAEKVPFLLLALGMSIATLHAQKAGGALSSLSGMPLATRVANALANYATYLENSFWPAGLAYFYPYIPARPAEYVPAAILLLAATGWFVWRGRRQPYLLAGWLWFLGTLVPTVGLVHVGIQSRADRYMYIPSIGLFVLLVWGVHDWSKRWPARNYVLAPLGFLALTICLAVTSIQLGCWQNSITLSEHAISVTRNNYVAYDSLGRALDELGLKPQAEACFARAVEIAPDFPQSQFNLRVALRNDGRLAEAAEHFAADVRLVPNRYDTRNAFGATLLLMNDTRLKDAAAQFSAALELNPDSAEAHHGLAVALARQGEITNALPHFAEAVRLDPTNAEVRFSLGLALLDAHQPAAAAAQFAEELRFTPDETRAHYRLAQALQQQNRLAEAVAHYRAALRHTPDFPEAAAALDQILATHPELKGREPLDIAH